ncbi:alpha/beta fold hydrolase [Luteimonas sp. XNQY3]|nr:alpha/beta fold hydrolase [Luteimonas sp. XNQY3]MCD9006295.1 alpha/beta fold hydrolase [Luteimonas sp. XNQY3]
MTSIASTTHMHSLHEQTIAALFGQALGMDIQQIDPTSGYLGRGAPPILAADLAAKIARAYDVELSSDSLNQHSTVRDIAAMVEDLGKRLPQGEPLLLRSGTDTLPLFCVHPSSGFGRPYSVLVPHLAPGMIVFALEARGCRDDDALPASLDAMCATYMDQIRHVHGSGPCHLLGWSFGAIPAHVLATRMQREGMNVASLVLVDGFPFDGTPWMDQLMEGHRAFWQHEIQNFREVQHASAARRAELLDRLCAIKENNIRLQRYADRRTFTGDALLIRCGPHPFPWADHVSGTLAEHTSSFGHNVLMTAEAAAEYGPVIARHLQHAEARFAPAQGAA